MGKSRYKQIILVPSSISDVSSTSHQPALFWLVDVTLIGLSYEGQAGSSFTQHAAGNLYPKTRF